MRGLIKASALIIALFLGATYAFGQNSGSIGVPGAYPEGGTDDQTISISNDTIFLEDGGFVVVPGGGTDDQTISISNDTIYLEDGGFVVLPEASNLFTTNLTQGANRAHDGNGFSFSMTGGSDITMGATTISLVSGSSDLFLTSVDDIKLNSVSGSYMFTTDPPTDNAEDVILAFDQTTDQIELRTVASLPADGIGSSPTSGAILFGQGTTTAGIDASNLFWDDANNRLGIGTATPIRQLDIYNTSTPALSLHNSAGGNTASDGFTLSVVSLDAYIWNYENGTMYFGNNAGAKMSIANTGQIDFKNYTSAASFTGTAAGYLAFNSSGNIITAAVPAAADGLGSSPTSGAILFGQGTTTAAIDASNLFWDDANNRLGIGTATPSAALQVHGTSTIEGVFNALAGNPDFALAQVGDIKAQIKYDVTNNGIGFFVNDANTGIVGITGTPELFVDDNQNIMINTRTAGTAAAGNLVMLNGTAPSTSPANSIALYAEDVSASSELKVRDEAGNITVLSPHNFSKIPEGPSEEMAWSFYSERDGKYVNVDMLKLARLVEELTGEKLVHLGKINN